MVDCHHQEAHHESNTRRLSLALGVIVVFMVVEVIGGVISGSLALLADATHMLTDALALGLAATAQYLVSKPASDRLSFGFRRARVLAAFVNGILLAVLLAWIVIEAAHRLFNPVPVDSSLMLWVALLGLAANAVAFLLLHRRHEDDLNMRGAMLHVLGDLLGSVAAIIAAVVIRFTGWLQIDPLLSMLVAALIGVSAWRLVRETGFILMEAAPETISVNNLRETIQSLSPEIEDVHQIQLSQITPDEPRLSLHVCISDNAEPNDILFEIKRVILADYGITTSTIQLERGCCVDKIEAPTNAAAKNAGDVHQPGDVAMALK